MADASLNKDQDEAPKHVGGRPLTCKMVDELKRAIQKYFDTQDPHIVTVMITTGHTTQGETMFDDRKIITEQKPNTISGLARALGLDHRSLLDYKNRDKFFPSIQAAHDRVEEYAEA